MHLRGKTRMGIFARYGYLIENIVSYKKKHKKGLCDCQSRATLRA